MNEEAKKWIEEPQSFTWNRRELMMMWDELQKMQNLNESIARELLSQIPEDGQQVYLRHIELLKGEINKVMDMFKKTFRLVEIGLAD